MILGLPFQKKYSKYIKKQPDNLTHICNWLVEHKSSIHFGADKTRPIFFSIGH